MLYSILLIQNEGDKRIAFSKLRDPIFSHRRSLFRPTTKLPYTKAQAYPNTSS
jgi:hypothetical protein